MWYGSTRENIRLVHLDIQITSKCTLKCRYCANLMQYYPEELQIHEKTEDVIRGIDEIFKLISFIDEVFIVGGEPFAHPDIAEIIKCIDKHKSKINYLCVASNGIGKIDHKTINALRETQIPVHITIYPRFYPEQIEKCAALIENGINANVHPRTWTKSTQRADGTPETFYKGCRRAVSPCVTLRGNKVWYCEFASNAHALGCKSGYINIDTTDKSNLYDYLNPNNPLNACAFCSGFSNIEVEPGKEQCDTPLHW